MSIVFAKIPKSGLGNCMLVWAHALVFARINKLELTTSRWKRFRWGAIMRREKRNRLYSGYFNEISFFYLLILKIQIIFKSKEYDPAIKEIRKNQRKEYFIFTKRSPDDDLFKYLVPHENLIKNELLKLLAPSIKDKHSKCNAPEIAIHVRRGDFKIANPITPNVFFINVINYIRESIDEDLPVTVFTDADAHEISEILSLKNITLSENKEDILDLLQMSKSKFIVLSRSSSFGYWAAFLSKAFVIMSNEEWQQQIKPTTNEYAEFRFSNKTSHSDFKNWLNSKNKTKVDN